MTKPRVDFLAVVLAVFAIAWIARAADKEPTPGGSPTLVNTCLITKDVNRLVQFYEPILVLKAKRTGEDYAEFPTGVGVLAIFSEDAQERYFLARRKQRRTTVWCCNFASRMWIKNTGGYIAL